MRRQQLAFWQLSSRNREKGKFHPLSWRRRELILELWAIGMRQDEIVERVDLQPRTIAYIIARARKAGDARAVVRHAATLKMLEAG